VATLCSASAAGKCSYSLGARALAKQPVSVRRHLQRPLVVHVTLRFAKA
jgi:hypothetical protein